MKQIKVLGSGCKKCDDTAELIKQVIEEKGIEASIVKETNPETIMRYRVMSTPAVVVDEVVVHAGSLPTKAQIVQWVN